MLAHLPNRFNALTRVYTRRGARHIHASPENHYNGAKLYVFAGFAFAQATSRLAAASSSS